MRIKVLALALSLLPTLLMAVESEYVFPGPEGEEAFTHFPLKVTEWSESNGKLRARYLLPADLVGLDDVEIDLSGDSSANNAYILSGLRGQGTCTHPPEGFDASCSIHLKNIPTDANLLLQRLQGRGASAEEIAKRLDVLERFSTEPIGVINVKFDYAPVL